MSARERTKQNRIFLHDLATPLSVLDIVMNQLVTLRSKPSTPESLAKHDKLLEQAKNSLAKMKKIHADFRELQSARDHEDREHPEKKAC